MTCEIEEIYLKIRLPGLGANLIHARKVRAITFCSEHSRESRIRAKIGKNSLKGFIVITLRLRIFDSVKSSIQITNDGFYIGDTVWV